MANPKTLHLTRASSDYAYINARIRGMKAHLLTATHYQELMGSKTLQDVVEILQNTHFAHALQTIGTSLTSKTLEEVFRRDLSSTVHSALGLLEGRPRKLFETLLLYWDMEAIRTILRGKFSNRSSEQILSSTLPVGRLNSPLLEELAKAADIPSVVQILYQWKFVFGKELMKVLRAFEESPKMLILESALEKSFFMEIENTLGAFNRLEKLLTEFLSDLHDFFNVRAALRLREQSLSPEESLNYFHGKGTHCGKTLFASIIHQETSEAACNLVCLGLALSEKSSDEMSLERILEHQLIHKGMKAILGDPLSFDLLLGFLWHKIAEIRNVRILVTGRLAGIRTEKLEEELVHA